MPSTTTETGTATASPVPETQTGDALRDTQAPPSHASRADHREATASVPEYTPVSYSQNFAQSGSDPREVARRWFDSRRPTAPTEIRQEDGTVRNITPDVRPEFDPESVAQAINHELKFKWSAALRPIGRILPNSAALLSVALYPAGGATAGAALEAASQNDHSSALLQLIEQGIQSEAESILVQKAFAELSDRRYGPTLKQAILDCKFDQTNKERALISLHLFTAQDAASALQETLVFPPAVFRDTDLSRVISMGRHMPMELCQQTLEEYKKRTGRDLEADFDRAMPGKNAARLSVRAAFNMISTSELATHLYDAMNKHGFMIFDRTDEDAVMTALEIILTDPQAQKVAGRVAEQYPGGIYALERDLDSRLSKKEKTKLGERFPTAFPQWAPEEEKAKE